ncbi:hypothetical protein DUNSADRAFT_7688 [Dunaliella salina]|uniref:Uncharacterized protein n=1 Tax=Dunaliella salina TaxID=3046 RepID=A0ABQ7H683_DUNSA|nr:hypothetical protein DUNSADRAFT_7688 [Dunaliella salina]|eukprot:KAF5842374.1 hypothetical protein DUNSADRAFT_7688 [Dunaliella salina]
MHQQLLQAHASQRVSSSLQCSTTANISRALGSVRVGERPVFRDSSSFCKQGLLYAKGGGVCTTPRPSALHSKALPPQEEERQKNESPASKRQQEEASTSRSSFTDPEKADVDKQLAPIWQVSSEPNKVQDCGLPETLQDVFLACAKGAYVFLGLPKM